mmetsp:Transcript_15736/g.44643  ORF Transcript_15736/g.44643 Transcript_15736/m.44643 type:complete len:223 (+) Transcript_15736:84-752(+)
MSSAFSARVEWVTFFSSSMAVSTSGSRNFLYSCVVIDAAVFTFPRSWRSFTANSAPRPVTALTRTKSASWSASTFFHSVAASPPSFSDSFCSTPSFLPSKLPLMASTRGAKFSSPLSFVKVTYSTSGTGTFHEDASAGTTRSLNNFTLTAVVTMKTLDSVRTKMTFGTSTPQIHMVRVDDFLYMSSSECFPLMMVTASAPFHNDSPPFRSSFHACTRRPSRL